MLWGGRWRDVTIVAGSNADGASHVTTQRLEQVPHSSGARQHDHGGDLRHDMARLRFVMDQIKEVEQARAQELEQAPQEKTHVIVRLLARIMGIGLETADMLVHEVLARNWRDRRAVARYAGLTGSPDESGSRRREKGLAKAGNARVRRGMIQLAWRFLLHQKESALAQWYR